MLTASDNAAVVRAHYDAINRRDMDLTLALATDDVKSRSIPFGTHQDGPEAYRESFENLSAAMPDFSIQIVNLVATEEWTAVEFILRGNHTGPLSGPDGTIPPTDKRQQFECCEFLRITDGQISESHLYLNTSSLLLQPVEADHAPMAFGRYA